MVYRDEEELKAKVERLEQKINTMSPGLGMGYLGFDYKSKFRLFGMPFIHVATGVDPATGGLRVARGFIAIGNVAIGVLALGGVSIGIFAIGGLALGVFSFAGLALGIVAAFGGVAIGGYLAAGGLAIAGYVAFGGLAISLNYAYGGMAIGKHAWGGNVQDPKALEFLKALFPDWNW